MLLGIIADDFTGASDIANTLAKGIDAEGGLRTSQYLGVPDFAAEPGVEAGIVALKTRSVPAHEAIELSLKALSWLKAQGCRQFVFKYCSTFDSTPVGNIGPVGEALAEALGVYGVIACPAFPTVGRTVYKGHLFVGERLLNESGMEKHPLNPMTDPDIRRWLAQQCRAPVGLVDWSAVSRGAHAIEQALDHAAHRRERLVIVDALSDEDLMAIGEACKSAPLLTGGSGITIGLPRNYIRAGQSAGGHTFFAGLTGPEAILAGSCSQATRQQIEVHARSHPVMNLNVEELMRREIPREKVVEFVLSNTGREPLVYSSDTPENVHSAQVTFGRDEIALALERLFAEIASELMQRGVKRLVVAGGETSGAVASALKIRQLTVGPEIAPGVPILFTSAPKPIALALKSGNFGAPEFFSHALAQLSSGRKYRTQIGGRTMIDRRTFTTALSGALAAASVLEPNDEK